MVDKLDNRKSEILDLKEKMQGFDRDELLSGLGERSKTAFLLRLTGMEFSDIAAAWDATGSSACYHFHQGKTFMLERRAAILRSRSNGYLQIMTEGLAIAGEKVSIQTAEPEVNMVPVFTSMRSNTLPARLMTTDFALDLTVQDFIESDDKYCLLKPTAATNAFDLFRKVRESLKRCSVGDTIRVVGSADDVVLCRNGGKS